jgi:hypothetical protein
LPAPRAEDADEILLTTKPLDFSGGFFLFPQRARQGCSVLYILKNHPLPPTTPHQNKVLIGRSGGFGEMLLAA